MAQSENSTLFEYFPPAEIKWARSVIYEFHDKLFLDDKLSGTNALLIAFYMCSNKNKCSEVEYNEVRDLFVKLGRRKNDFKVYLHRARKEGLIDERKVNKSKLLSLKIKGLKTVKNLLGQSSGAKALLIKSGTIYSGKKLFKEIVLSKPSFTIKICDPYVGVRLLDILSEITSKCEIYILTQTIERSKQFKRELEDFKKEFQNIKIEIRVLEGNKLHDRYIITETDYWSIGSSIKDIGKKDALITKLPDEIKYALAEVFNRRWQNAKPLN